jgi:hypothetical protein
VGSAREFTLAQELGIETLGPYPTPDEVPAAPEQCPAYQQLENRDTCASIERRCPPGMTCPIRRRCRCLKPL